jgi:hypothetical protein
MGIFEIVFYELFALGWLGAMIFLISASSVARGTFKIISSRFFEIYNTLTFFIVTLLCKRPPELFTPI